MCSASWGTRRALVLPCLSALERLSLTSNRAASTQAYTRGTKILTWCSRYPFGVPLELFFLVSRRGGLRYRLRRQRLQTMKSACKHTIKNKKNYNAPPGSPGLAGAALCHVAPLPVIKQRCHNPRYIVLNKAHLVQAQEKLPLHLKAK